MAKNNTLLIAGGAAVALYLLSKSNSTPGAPSNPVSSALSLLTNAAPAATAQPLTGINSGILGGNGSFYTVANYSDLAAADPNLLNPKYQLSPIEAQQYYNNYSDLQEWYSIPYVAAKFGNVQSAMQYHFSTYGCAGKRIFLPLVPPSNANYINPPPQPKSSGSGILGTLLKIGTGVAGTLLAPVTGGASLVAASAAVQAENALIHGINSLNDDELAIAFKGAAIAKSILPYFASANPKAVTIINNRIDDVLAPYI